MSGTKRKNSFQDNIRLKNCFILLWLWQCRLLPGEPSQRRRCAVRTAFGRVGTCQAEVLFTTKSFYAFSVSSAKFPCQCPQKAKQRPKSQPYRPKDSNCFFCFADIFQAALLFPAPAQSSDFMESFQSCPFHFLI